MGAMCRRIGRGPTGSVVIRLFSHTLSSLVVVSVGEVHWRWEDVVVSVGEVHWRWEEMPTTEIQCIIMCYVSFP